MRETHQKKKLKILIVEDVGSDAELVKLSLTNFDYLCHFEVCSSKNSFSTQINLFIPDIVLSDFNLPGFSGLTALSLLREHDDLTPFIFVTGTLTEDNAVEAIRQGATDFILKKDLGHLPAAVLRAMREKKHKMGKQEALNSLEASEKRFAALVQEGSDLIGVLDIEANYLFVSKSSKRILGIKPEDFIGKNAFDFIHPDDEAWVRQKFSSLTANKRVQIGPFRFKNSKGDWRWIETIATNTLEEAAIKGIIVNSRDITNKIEREESLKLSNERYRLASLATKDIIYDWELDSNHVTRTGDGINRLFGYTQNDLQSDARFWEQHVHPDDKDLAYKKLQTALGTPSERYCEHEYRFQKADGSFAWVYDKGYIIRDKTGKAIRLVGALRDVTEQKNQLAQQELVAFLRREIGTPGPFKQAAINLLKLITDYAGVEVGELWLTAVDDTQLNLVAHFGRSKKSEALYPLARQNHFFERGKGLPGKVWVGRKIVVWRNLDSNNDFQRRKEATEAGLSIAYGAPILYGQKVIGVFVFFDGGEHHSLTDLSNVLSTIGTQLGPDIQRKKLEEELNNFFELSTDILAIAGTDGFYKKVNPAFSRVLGYSEEELLKIPYLELTHPDDRERTKSEMVALNSGKSTHNFESRYVSKENKDIWLSWSATPLPEQKLLYAVGKDITEKKKTEKALKESLDQLKTAQQIAKLGYWTHDFKTNEPKWAEEMFMIWEQDPAKWKPTFNNLKKTVHHEDQKKLLGLNLKKLEGLRRNSKEYRIETPSGEIKWISEIITVYNEENGQPERMDGVAQDITERKKLELLYREIGLLAKVGAWELDLVEQNLFWSSITKEIHEVAYDFTPELDRAIDFYKAGKSRDTITRYVNMAIESGMAFDVELQIVTAKGNERWVRATGKPVFINNKCVRLVGSFQDIHARKVAEEERKEILESITDGFFAVDKTWKVIFWNTSASQMLGVSKAEEIVGQELWAEVPILKKSRFYPQAHHALEKQQPFVAVEEFKARKRWFEISLFPKSGGLSVYFKDITKETEQQQQILKIKNNLDTTINSTNDLIFSIDANMRLISANRAFRDRLKVAFNTEIKEGYPIVLPTEDREAMDKWKKHLTRALMGEQFTVTEEDVVNGHTFYSLVSFNPFMESGLCVGAACFVKDITERTIHLNAIEEQNQRLRDIAWMQSHVVRAPVARIMGLIELISSDHSKEEDKAQLLQYVDLSAKQLDGIIRDITAKTAKIDPLGDGD
ncbi:PAS domain S-box protein [uncultured Imperialibacter sp.]|uniref:PAS domain S-box protein n=1 Tax=uncultured Imperialibacter sp. TaxID=1672639 RepID=UPI0030DAF929|tara:strand:- start:114483 stop:118214 length:3732 start_codon:yes stop_codon:yes gene_type:complete